MTAPPRPAESHQHNIMYRLWVTTAEIEACGGDPWWVQQIADAAQIIHNLNLQLQRNTQPQRMPPGDIEGFR